MLRRLLSRPDAGRQAVLALLPVVMGASLLLASGDRASTESSVLETTKGPAWPMLLDAPAPTSTSVAPTTPAAEHSAGATMGGSLSVAAGPGESTSGSPSGPDPDMAAGTGTGTGTRTEVAGPASAQEGGAGRGAALPVADDPADAPVDEPADQKSTTAPDPAPQAAAGDGAEAAPAARAPGPTTTTTKAAPPPAPTSTTGGRARDTGVEAEVVPLTNQDRKAQGLGALSRNACLDSVASGYAEKMARTGVLAHNPGAGPAVHGCRPNASWGDNVGTAAPCDTARLERDWMASPGHRRNILNGDYKLIGVGAWTDNKGGCWIQVLFSS